ncbi:hypothetical protein KZX50_00560 [Bacillus infantis]|uniref:hypothetical protein n=1 Tax=Bacillus infantis TaxID=324767 RepID=UPI002005BE76|nr:hypothetical protein [Bacillus infantis]MCK6203939.1 hypothetical protein [Bacillus infantis]
MIYLFTVTLILIAFILYVKMSMDNIQKLTDKIMAGNYKEYKREARADEQLQAEIEISKENPPAPEPERDYNYL